MATDQFTFQIQHRRALLCRWFAARCLGLPVLPRTELAKERSQVHITFGSRAFIAGSNSIIGRAASHGPRRRALRPASGPRPSRKLVSRRDRRKPRRAAKLLVSKGF